MEKKKILTKTAVAALLLAATLPVDGQAKQIAEVKETFLATAGCGAHGCGGVRRGELADNTANNGSYSNSQSSGSYGSGAGYTGTSSGMGTGGNGYSGTSGYGGSTSGNFGNTSGSYSNTDTSRMNRDLNSSRNTNESYQSARTYNDSYGNYNSNRSYSSEPGYRESYRSSTYNVNVGTPYEYGTDARVNRGYNTAGTVVGEEIYSEAPGSDTLTEAALLEMLSPQGRAIYISLDAEGKALALQLASQDTYRDKNLAVKEAQRRINEKRGMLSR